MTLLILFITAALIIISLQTIVNIFVLPRLSNQTSEHQEPFVSVLIPARNEAQVIENTLRSLVDQDYPNLEVLILDDNSTDDTARIISQFEAQSSQIHLIAGQPLPDGWMGKNWACHQLQQSARGDVLIFTDADVVWASTAVRAVVENMHTTDADLFTVWPTQHTETMSERLVVPLMAMVILGYLPIIGTHFIRFAPFGAANGQCMAWKRSAYAKVGGHAAVADNVLEDVTLAKMVKSAGLRLRMADGNHHINCRMYDGWQSVRDGYAKNILAGYANSVPFLIFGIVFHWLVFLFPLVELIVSTLTDSSTVILFLMLVILGIGTRALSAAYSQQRVIDAIWMPISVILMTHIALQAIYWHFRYGGPQWKGRIVTQSKKASSNG